MNEWTLIKYKMSIVHTRTQFDVYHFKNAVEMIHTDTRTNKIQWSLARHHKLSQLQFTYFNEIR